MGDGCTSVLLLQVNNESLFPKFLSVTRLSIKYEVVKEGRKYFI